MKNVKDFFNDNVYEWSDDTFNEKQLCKVVEMFYECYSKAKNLKPKILDIGCGIGYESKILANLGAKVTGIDFIDGNIEKAKVNVENADFFVKDITEPLENLGRFDGAICLETLDYIGNEKIETTIKNISKVLKSGALLLVSVLNGNEKNDERSFVKIGENEYDKNFHCYDAEQLCTYAYPELKLVDTWQFNDFNEGWRYYVFMKQNIDSVEDKK